MTRWRALWALAPAFAACGGPTPTALPAALVEATAEVSCAPDAGACAAPFTFVSAPHCGHDFSAIDPDGGVARVDTGIAASKLVGLVELRTTAVTLTGRTEVLEPRRYLLNTGVTAMRVYPAFSAGGPLYEINSLGTLTVVADAGVLDGGPGVAAFTYEVPAVDAGSRLVVERHRVVAAWTQAVDVRDHSGEPFYGCCAHVGALTPAAALALLALRRRRLSRPGTRPATVR